MLDCAAMARKDKKLSRWGARPKDAEPPARDPAIDAGALPLGRLSLEARAAAQAAPGHRLGGDEEQTSSEAGKPRSDFESTIAGHLAGQQADARAAALMQSLAAREKEIAELRVLQAASGQALGRAEEQLQAAARRIDESDELRRRSVPPPPNEANDARVRAARLSVELTEVRQERDLLRQQVEQGQAETQAARAAESALIAAQSVRDTRAQLAEAQASQAEARTAQRESELAAAHKQLEAVRREEMELRIELTQARTDLARLAEEGSSAREAQGRLVRGETEVRNALDLAHRELDAQRAQKQELKDELAGVGTDLNKQREELAGLRNQLQSLRDSEARLRGEVEQERVTAHAREDQIVAEVRDREARMVVEVQGREGQLVAAAQAREAQLVAATQAREAQLAAEARAAVQAAAARVAVQSDQLEQLKKAVAEARDREAALDAELRVVLGHQREETGDLEDAAQAARHEAHGARAELDTAQERLSRAEARATESQAVIDSLGRERAALRAEAGAMRARVEALGAQEQRAQKLQQELDDLRGENDFLNQEVARIASATSNPRIAIPPPLPGKIS